MKTAPLIKATLFVATVSCSNGRRTVDGRRRKSIAASATKSSTRRYEQPGEDVRDVTIAQKEKTVLGGSHEQARFLQNVGIFEESKGPFLPEFGSDALKVEYGPPKVVDVNSDDISDIVVFEADGVHVALGKEDGGFDLKGNVLQEFGYDHGWRVDAHPRMMADVNGDGRADIVGFGHGGVVVALASGDGGFDFKDYVLEEFGDSDGWEVEKHPRMMADVNGDGKADIVGFGHGGVVVALASRDGGFDFKDYVLEEFGDSDGWEVGKHPRMMADVNGDGKADIVGFGHAGVIVALASRDGGFDLKGNVLEQFGYDRGWEVGKHPRMMADVNGDGKADIVGFGHAGVIIALANGEGGFDFKGTVLKEFGYDDGWRVEKHLRMMADMDGDGTAADIVGFNGDGVHVALLSPLGECRSSTRALDELIHSDYDQSGAKIAEIAAEAEGEPDRILFVDFATTAQAMKTAKYEVSCNSEGGHIEKVTYEATCTSQSEKVALFVNEQPRCYHDICGTDAATEAALLEEFAIKPTQELASESGDNWSCTGTLKVDVPNACEYESNEISLQKEIAAHSLLSEPTIKQKKWLLFISVSDTYVVNFPPVAGFKDTCEGIGTYQELATFNIVCTKSESEKATTFEVNGFSPCLGGACADSAEIGHTGLIQKELVQAGEIGSDAACQVSGAALKASLMGAAAVAGIFSSLWLLF